jgi:hypothetical protein
VLAVRVNPVRSQKEYQMLTTRDERIEKAREIVCDSLGVVRDSLMNSELRHTDNEREMLLSLAARLVLQAIDNDVAELGRALSSIRQVLEADYPPLASPH